MSVRTFVLRCSHCKVTTFVTVTLEQARLTRCRHCQQKMTVSGYRENGELKPGEPVAITTAPPIESAFWKPTPEQTAKAREMVISALGKEV